MRRLLLKILKRARFSLWKRRQTQLALRKTQVTSWVRSTVACLVWNHFLWSVSPLFCWLREYHNWRIKKMYTKRGNLVDIVVACKTCDEIL